MHLNGNTHGGDQRILMIAESSFVICLIIMLFSMSMTVRYFKAVSAVLLRSVPLLVIDFYIFVPGVPSMG